MSPALECPWSPPALPELRELTDLDQQLQLEGIGDLLFDHQLGLESAIGAGSQVYYYYPEHNEATVTVTQFADADLAELLNEDLVHMLGGWGGQRRRKCGTRRKSWRIYLSGFKKHFSCENWNARKNNPHWREDEGCMLLDGLSEYGVGRWTEIKKAYFHKSIRTAMHLKEKWKNLKEASGPKVRSRKKVQAHKSTQEILRRWEDQIIEIDMKHAAQERRASRRK